MLFEKRINEKKRSETHQRRIIQSTSSHNGNEVEARIRSHTSGVRIAHMWLCRVVVDRVITIQIALQQQSQQKKQK